MDGDVAARLRGLPKVQALLDSPQAAPLLAATSRAAVLAAVRGAVDAARAELLRDGGAAPDAAALLARAGDALEQAGRPVLRRVINATGIVIHTNLGRAPLAPEAVAAVAAAAGGYCNLEFDLAAGARGSRTQGVEPLLCTVTGAEAAVAVNNCAAAMLLALAALAGGGEVVVSRGELVEIGGGFRIPDVIRQGGARLVEVGATNKTRLADYRDAVTPATRVLLKVHQSNFSIVGFTEEVEVAALAGLAKETGLLVVDDLGSGLIVGPGGVRDSLAAGADLVAFSGDKLLGGPQAGLLAGRHAAVDPLRRHPLMRALRLDKMTLAALEATLRLHRDSATDRIPVLRAMAQNAGMLQARAERLAALLGPPAQMQPTTGYAGGGALPNEGIASIGVSLECPGVTPDQLALALRQGCPAVVGRIADGRVLLDVLTVTDAELPELAQAVQAALPVAATPGIVG